MLSEQIPVYKRLKSHFSFQFVIASCTAEPRGRLPNGDSPDVELIKPGLRQQNFQQEELELNEEEVGKVAILGIPVIFCDILPKILEMYYTSYSI